MFEPRLQSTDFIKQAADRDRGIEPLRANFRRDFRIGYQCSRWCVVFMGLA